MKRTFFTSESVTEGHPDKMCDQISDAILDNILAQDPGARVACETITTTGFILVMGEISTKAYADIRRIVRDTAMSIGYTSPETGFDANTCAVLISLDEQSTDIALGVNCSLESKERHSEADCELGAGDQGLMFGYACDETPELMPLPISLAHRMAKRLAEVRKKGIIPYLRPDGKTQVTVEYDDGVPVRADTIVVSAQHAPEVGLEVIRRDILKEVIRPSVPGEFLDDRTKIYINPTGRFVIGGPNGDSGLTGRKIIVDTYGGYSRHGGGAFSGKDPTKVDRSASYAARYLAKNVVKAGLARRCEVQLAYAIGVASPVSILVDTFGTGAVSENAIEEMIRAHCDLRPDAIIRKFDLRRPIYRPLAAYGHMGREDIGAPWEKTDLAEIFKKEALKTNK